MQIFKNVHLGKMNLRILIKKILLLIAILTEAFFSNDFSISDVDFQHSIFRQVAFINGSLKNIVFYSSTLEDTVFSNVSMEKSDLMI